jgi:hypothetical protein
MPPYMNEIITGTSGTRQGAQVMHNSMLVEGVRLARAIPSKRDQCSDRQLCCSHDCHTCFATTAMCAPIIYHAITFAYIHASR